MSTLFGSKRIGIWGLIVSAAVFVAGCRARDPFRGADPREFYVPMATRIEYPDAADLGRPEALDSLPPRTPRSIETTEYWELPLEEAVQLALANSQTIRDLGGRVLTAPGAVSTVYDIALAETNPRTGPEAALSDFDAQFTTDLFFNRNERALNNLFFGGGTTALVQDQANFSAGITKRAATGTTYAFRNVTTYDRSNAPANRFPSAYETLFEGEVRQPLLQGAGIAFNRIAGPNATPGNYNGVLIARVNTDVRLADFELAVRDLVREVEVTYWQLYFAYRDLDAKIAQRDEALQVWNALKDRFDLGEVPREDEALAREQYFNAAAQVEDALSGTNTSGLVVGTSSGVYTVERRLRFLLGLPINDDRLIRPGDEPVTAPVAFDWANSVTTAAWRRVELRRQKWTIRRREMELIAARNFRRARLDAVGLYRVRGFGDFLTGNTDRPNGSAFENLLTWDLQEYEAGFQFQTPIGNRIGHTAIRNAELQLARERAVLRDQELGIIEELSAAFAELDRSFAVSRALYNRRFAAHQRLVNVEAKYRAGEVLLEFLLDAQQQAADADSVFFRALVNYNLAVSGVHLRRGTLLEYFGIELSEGPWVPDADRSAAKQARRFRPSVLNYCLEHPPQLSAGPYPQQTLAPLKRLPAIEPAEPVPALEKQPK